MGLLFGFGLRVRRVHEGVFELCVGSGLVRRCGGVLVGVVCVGVVGVVVVWFFVVCGGGGLCGSFGGWVGVCFLLGW